VEVGLKKKKPSGSFSFQQTGGPEAKDEGSSSTTYPVFGDNEDCKHHRKAYELSGIPISSFWSLHKAETKNPGNHFSQEDQEYCANLCLERFGLGVWLGVQRKPLLLRISLDPHSRHDAGTCKSTINDSIKIDGARLKRFIQRCSECGGTRRVCV
jgi:hypothetical protein